MRKALGPKRATVPPAVTALQPVNRGTPGEAAPEGELERLRAELREALDRQAAVGEVLRTINSSAFDLQAVFRRVCEQSARSCDAFSVALWLRVGDQFSYADSWSEDEESYEAFSEHQRSHPFGLDAPGVIGRAYRAGKPVMIENVHADPEYPKEQLRYGQVGTLLGVPLIKDGVIVGGLSLNRRAVRLFSEHEIVLVQTFADQAVIAIENARLVNETKEALEQQTATGSVLDAISRSAFDVTPVMQMIASSSQSLCQADEAGVMLRDGDAFVLSATAGDWAARGGIGGRQHPDEVPDAPWVRALRSKHSTHIPDVRADPLMAGYVAAHAHDADFNNTRLVIPIIRDGDVIGVIRVGRKRQQPFTDRQVKLVEIFAAQAVIAIENVRLFNETREALKQQTALSAVLQSISQSAFDLDAVLATILRTANELCDADGCSLYRPDGDAMVVISNAGAAVPTTSAFHRLLMTANSVVVRAARTHELQHVPDIELEPALIRTGTRTRLAVPLLRNAELIGVLSIGRVQKHPFTEAEIQLVRTFADQAAIAMENVRLFNETREALDRQTAISEILRAIAGSPSDERPVLQTIATSAARYTGATDVVVFLARDDVMWAAGYHGDIPARPLPWSEIPLAATAVTGRAILEQRTIHVADVAGPEGEQFPDTRARAANSGFRAILAVPLVREGRALGALYLRKPEPVAFTTGQIQLVETFANQAVIAIENVRLFNETKDALERQTATADVLRLISRSAFDLSSVLNALIETATRLAKAHDGTMFVLEGDRYRPTASSGELTPEYQAAVGPTSAATGTGVVSRAGRTGQPVQIVDVLADPDASPTMLELARAGGYRTILGVPLLRDGVAIGVLSLRRTTVRAFSDAEIALVSSYADQAVIAMENVRLFTETKQALEQQTATSEVLKAISDSTSDLDPMFEQMLAKAVQLCGADYGQLYEEYRLAASINLPPELRERRVAENLKNSVGAPADRTSLAGRVRFEQATVQIPDVTSDQEMGRSPTYQDLGIRSLLGVPMRHGGEVRGVITLWKKERGPFPPAGIRLVETFADQAMIAIEKLRLFNETKEALERQTATSDVLAIISRTTSDASEVFDAIVRRAATLCGADHAWIWRVDNDQSRYYYAAYHGDSTDLREQVITRTWLPRPTPTNPTISARVERTGATVHIPDVADDPTAVGPRMKEIGAQSAVAVPLLKNDELLGIVTLVRTAVRPFSAKEIALAETFADQAVIAIENVRLFNEIQDKSAELEVANRALGEASRHKSAFLANMSHELRTPLNAIIGFSDVLEQRMFGELNDRQTEYVRDISGSGRHLLTLVNEILDLAKVEAGRMELEPTEFVLEETIRGAIAFVRERASQHRIELTTDVAPDTGTVVADERKVRQVLLNLLSNAVKFTPDGGTVRVGCRRDGGEAELSVCDTGIGIATDDLPRVFEEFQQVGGPSARAHEGTGLGLTLAKRFIELHGGRIWVDSEVGKGTTFTFRIPSNTRHKTLP